MSTPAETVKSLVRDAEQAAARMVDPIALVASVLRTAIAKGADPYLLSGVMVEAIAETIARKVPPERRGDVAVEAVRMLRDRLRGHGVA